MEVLQNTCPNAPGSQELPVVPWAPGQRQSIVEEMLEGEEADWVGTLYPDRW